MLQYTKRAKQDQILEKMYSEDDKMEIDKMEIDKMEIDTPVLLSRRECKEVRNLKSDAWCREAVETVSRELKRVDHFKTTVSEHKQLELSRSSDSSYSWECPKCSVLNTAEALDCAACYYHRRRTKRRGNEFVHEDKHGEKESASQISQEYSPTHVVSQDGVHSLRDLVRQPWLDGWKTARKLASDLAEEAKIQAHIQEIPSSEMKQLPTRPQLTNPDTPHVRKWFDREPTLAKKFLRACGLIRPKSNGTFISEHVESLEELVDLVRDGDPSRTRHDSDSENETQDDKRRGEKPLLDRPPFLEYIPKLKAYLHRPNELQPFVFKVPLHDLSSVEELDSRLKAILGPQPFPKLRIDVDRAGDRAPLNSWEDLRGASFIHIQQTL